MDAAPSPPKRRRLGAIAGILLVVAAIICAAGYAILTAPGPPEDPPSVTLTLLAPGDPGDPRVVEVTEATPELPLSSFRISVREVSTYTEVFAATLSPGTLYADGATTFTCEDLTVPGRLSVGDEFRLADFPPQASYGLTLVHISSQRSIFSVTVAF